MKNKNIKKTEKRRSEDVFLEAPYNKGDGNRNDPLVPGDSLKGKPVGTTTQYDPDNPYTTGGDKRDPKAGLAHELLGHAYDVDQGKSLSNKITIKNGIPLSEVSAVNIENRARAALGEPQRTTYGSKQIPSGLLDKTHSKRRP